MLGKLLHEIQYFKDHPKGMRVLLLTNLIYALVLPVIELFIGAYIMRNSSDISLVVVFQLAVYTGIPLTFMINGFLLNKIHISKLYSFGMLLSGVSMTAMMSLDTLDTSGVFLAGLIMGLSFGFFWANRDYLALATTNDGNRNYYYGVETFFYTLTFILVPFVVGVFIATTETSGWFSGNVNVAYYIVTGIVFALTAVASVLVHTGGFENPVKAPFLFLRFDKLWYKMLGLASLKGIAQGYIVTAPVMLIMKLVGNEGALGIIQSIGAVLSAILLYILGRAAKPKHRLLIYGIGLSLFLLGAFINTALYSAVGVILFVLCLIFARPLLDIAYFPIQLKVIDALVQKTKRNAFAYIFNHEIGLYAGRLFGCGLFILLARYISGDVALRYALLVIAVMHWFSYLVAKSIVRDTDNLPEPEQVKIAPPPEPTVL
jgi:YQGE family putative transporter